LDNYISIIICTYNRASLVKLTLEALSRQTFPSERFEIILVDDCSTDDTFSVYNKLKNELPNLRYISNPVNIGLPLSRNRGIEIAAGDYVLFTDDDCIPSEKWVEKMSFYLSQHPVIGGSIESPLLNYLQLCFNISGFHAFIPAGEVRPVDMIVGANMGFRMSVLKELGGFRNDFSLVEDIDISCRGRLHGYKLFFVPHASVLHNHNRMTVPLMLKSAFRTGTSSILLRNKYYKLMNTPFILRSPLLLLLTSPLIALKATISIYLKNSYLRNFFKTFPVVYMLKMAWVMGAFQSLRNQKLKEREKWKKI